VVWIAQNDCEREGKARLQRFPYCFSVWIVKGRLPLALVQVSAFPETLFCFIDISLCARGIVRDRTNMLLFLGGMRGRQKVSPGLSHCHLSRLAPACPARPKAESPSRSVFRELVHKASLRLDAELLPAIHLQPAWN